jgi:YegS/Rv2252/BmrU family lipid kinase
LKNQKKLYTIDGKWLFIIRERSAHSSKTTSALRKIFGEEHSYCVSEYAGHSIALAEAATSDIYQVVIAVGGDGTIHEVVNGLMNNMKKTGIPAPPLAILPAGTGNDFARTLRLKSSPYDLRERLLRRNMSRIDLGECTYINHQGQQESRYFVNVMDVGLGGTIASRVAQYRRGILAPLAYQRALMSTLPFYKRVLLEFELDENSYRQEVLCLAIANGKWFGKGIGISPDSSVHNEKLNSIAMGRLGILSYIYYLPWLLRGKRISHPEVDYASITRASIHQPRGIPIECDGECVGFTPATIQVLPGALTLIL